MATCRVTSPPELFFDLTLKVFAPLTVPAEPLVMLVALLSSKVLVSSLRSQALVSSFSSGSLCAPVIQRPFSSSTACGFFPPVALFRNSASGFR